MSFHGIKGSPILNFLLLYLLNVVPCFVLCFMAACCMVLTQTVHSIFHLFCMLYEIVQKMFRDSTLMFINKYLMFTNIHLNIFVWHTFVYRFILYFRGTCCVPLAWSGWWLFCVLLLWLLLCLEMDYGLLDNDSDLFDSLPSFFRYLTKADFSVIIVF